MISIISRMVKICDTSICRPLKLICQPCLESGKFPTEWKKANVFRVHKKDYKQILKNYRPMLLLPTVGKIFERLLCDSMFEFFIENNWIYIKISQVLDKVILVLISFSLSLMKFINLFMIALKSGL